MIRTTYHYFINWLAAPKRVALTCILTAFIGLAVDGSLLKWWELGRDASHLKSEIQEIRSKSTDVHGKILKFSDPKSIERQARERFEMVDEDDLLFVFSENE